jgi:hypothetical protein
MIPARVTFALYLARLERCGLRILSVPDDPIIFMHDDALSPVSCLPSLLATIGVTPDMTARKKAAAKTAATPKRDRWEQVPGSAEERADDAAEAAATVDNHAPPRTRTEGNTVTNT